MEEMILISAHKFEEGYSMDQWAKRKIFDKTGYFYRIESDAGIFYLCTMTKLDKGKFVSVEVTSDDLQMGCLVLGETPVNLFNSIHKKERNILVENGLSTFTGRDDKKTQEEKRVVRANRYVQSASNESYLKSKVMTGQAYFYKVAATYSKSIVQFHLVSDQRFVEGDYFTLKLPGPSNSTPSYLRAKIQGEVDAAEFRSIHNNEHNIVVETGI